MAVGEQRPYHREFSFSGSPWVSAMICPRLGGTTYLILQLQAGEKGRIDEQQVHAAMRRGLEYRC